MTRKKDEVKLTRSGVRHGSLRRSSSWANAGKAVLTAVITIALSGIAVGAYAALSLVNEVNTVELPAGPNAVAAGSQSIDGAFAIMLVGSDSRNGQSINDGETGELNDVNLVLYVSEDHKNATVISFPRDLMVPIPSCPGPKGEPDYYPAMSLQQINSTLSSGGLPCVVATVEQLSGLDINYAGLITFDGVIAMSNAIGGVKVCLTAPIVDPNTDLNLPAGTVNLKGKKALQFLRTRHGVGDGGDKSRISNQQVFMSAMLRKLKSAETLSNPVTVYALANAGLKNMLLSSNMANVQFLQALAGRVKDIDLSRINFVQYPTVTDPAQPGRLVPDSVNGPALMKLVKSGKPFTVKNLGTGVVDGDKKSGDETSTDTGTDTGTDSGTGTDTGKKKPKKSDTTANDPENLLGQPASEQTCSAGRTVY